MRYEFLDKIFRFGGGKLFVKGDDQKVGDAEIANQRYLMPCRGKQMRRVMRSQHFHRVRIESHNNRSSIFRLGVPGGSGNNGLVTAMDAVENADREEERAGQLAQLRNGMQCLH